MLGCEYSWHLTQHYVAHRVRHVSLILPEKHVTGKLIAFQEEIYLGVESRKGSGKLEAVFLGLGLSHVNQVTLKEYLKCHHCASLIHLAAKHSDHTTKNRYQSTCFTWLAGIECLCYTHSQHHTQNRSRGTFVR